MMFGHVRGLGSAIQSYSVVPRRSRVATAAHEVRVGDASGYLVNVSATGALVRLARSLEAQQTDWPMLIEIMSQPVQLRARVVRSREVTPTSAQRQDAECEVGLAFTDLPLPAMQALRSLCADAFDTQEERSLE